MKNCRWLLNGNLCAPSVSSFINLVSSRSKSGNVNSRCYISALNERNTLSLNLRLSTYNYTTYRHVTPPMFLDWSVPYLPTVYEHLGNDLQCLRE